MMDPAPRVPVTPGRMTADRYFGLVDDGLLGPDDRVELLEGVVVSMSPRSALHDATVTLVAQALSTIMPAQAHARVQCALRLGPRSVPEPDVAVVSGHARDYLLAHPTTALLVVEVADTSLAQDRVTKAAIYAAAGIREFWIVNLRDDLIEVYRTPDPVVPAYLSVTTARRGEKLGPIVFPGAAILVEDLLPPR